VIPVSDDKFTVDEDVFNAGRIVGRIKEISRLLDGLRIKYSYVGTGALF
jgi:hypothetical protein